MTNKDNAQNKNDNQQEGEALPKEQASALPHPEDKDALRLNNGFLSFELVIDVPGGAPNTGIPREEKIGKTSTTVVTVKSLTDNKGYKFPYISAQSFKKRLRDQLFMLDTVYRERTNLQYKIKNGDEWTILEAKTADSPDSEPINANEITTTGDPVTYSDDDIFGYMVAGEEITRTRPAPLRSTPFISAGSLRISEDFATMKRPGFHSNIIRSDIYRSAMKGTMLLHLTAIGTFWTAGSQHLNIVNEENFEEKKLTSDLEGPSNILGQPAYRMPIEKRAERASLVPLMIADADTSGYSTLKMTSYRPPIVIASVSHGAAMPFRFVIENSVKEAISLNATTLINALKAHQDVLLSPVWVGWDSGYAPDARNIFLETVDSLPEELKQKIVVDESRSILKTISEELSSPNNYHWYG